MSGTASTARKTGSGISTIPAPPPNGLSSTERRGSPAPARRSCTRTSSAPASTARAEDGGTAVARDQVGEDGEDVDPHRSSRPSGMSTSTVPAAGSCRVTKCAGMSPPESSTSRSLAGLASTAATRPRSAPWASRTVRADELVHPQRAGEVERLGLQVDAVQALGAGAVVDALEVHHEGAEAIAGAAHGAGAEHGERTAGGGQGRARVQAPGLVAPEVHHDLALQAVGPGDPADREERRLSRRRCPRWPARRHGRWPR